MINTRYFQSSEQVSKSMELAMNDDGTRGPNQSLP